MRSFFAINKRNISLYFRDYSAVFFSLLSMIIIIVLMVFFLGDINNGELLDAIKLVPGRGTDSDVKTIEQFSFLWTCAGILTINASTVTHAFFSNMIKDRTGNRLNSLLVMPVKRPVFVLGYISGAWISGVIMSIITFAFTEAIGVVKGMEVLPFEVHVKLLLLIMLNNFVYSAVMFLLASIIKSQSAWSGIGIILGTLSGFLGGIYFPIGSMSSTMQHVVKLFPFIYGTSLFRKVMMAPLENTFFDGMPEVVRTEVDRTMGMDIFINNNQLSEPGKVGILIAVGVVFIIISTIFLTISKKKDR
ncbi:ABC transporter permease [Butyrivibrio sp. FC2001]|uniref:ABC transporter permease n=1 Tax=Butyrivibrio sp. FC2001 TaxID=1280671 RepID=UPI00042203C0|nr:ABC transporter permease [Butyrivibrio sp. FC2001]